MNVLYCDRCGTANLNDRTILRQVMVNITKSNGGRSSLFNLDLCGKCDELLERTLVEFSKTLADANLPKADPPGQDLDTANLAEKRRKETYLREAREREAVVKDAYKEKYPRKKKKK